MRHLRRTKRVYAAKRQALLDCLQSSVGADSVTAPGLAVLLKLPKGTRDIAVAREALTYGMYPSPLSPWYVSPEGAESGLLLGVATAPMKNLARSHDRLFEIVQRLR
ncbi:GntR family transcriptional regulator/MocR family aminotransferase [Rhizobium leucaenae]|nr:GntR family transcriptional regulator/MocR family aminotransferase [Rhizobium leucaenae]